MKCNLDYDVATFKGVEFEILPVEFVSKGQVILTHLYPLTGFHYNEEIITSTPKQFTVNGAFHGDDMRDKLQTAQRIWSAGGSGVFFEPTQNKNHTVVLSEPVTYTFDHKKLNYCEFTLTLVEKGNSPYPNGILGALNQVNSVIDGFISTVSNVYSEVMQTVGSFREISSGIYAAKSFISNTVRQTTNNGQSEIRKQVGLIKPSRSPISNVNSIIDVYEKAAENEAPIKLFRQLSEVRIDGNQVEEEQGKLVALIGIAYYFEKIAKSNNFSELSKFRERVDSLKEDSDSALIINALDSLLVSAARVSENDIAMVTHTASNALVASYLTFGDVSQAYVMLERFGGVSGAVIYTE